MNYKEKWKVISARVNGIFVSANYAVNVLSNSDAKAQKEFLDKNTAKANKVRKEDRVY